MQLPESMPLFKIKVGEHFILQGTEYIRVGNEVEEGGIFCKNVKEGSSGLLSNDRPVIKLEDKTFLAGTVGGLLAVEPALPKTEKPIGE